VVVDYLCNQAIEQDMAVACFYYDFASQEAQSPTNMLGSLLKQLLPVPGAIPAEIGQRFWGHKKVVGGRKLQLPDIVKMFATVSPLRRTFICVDALDECVPKHLLEVLDALGQILWRSPNTRMFMTGRPHILGAVERKLGGRTTNVAIKPRDDDMVMYLRARLSKDTTPEVMNCGLENDIMNSVHGGVSETYVEVGARQTFISHTDRSKCRFLMVSLKLEAILRETTIHRRRKRLHAMGDGLGLGDAYEATLERVRAQEGEKAKLAMTALMWICHSERPLRVDELCHALAVEIGATSFNNDNVPATETLLACCQGLVTVDKEASTARLVHHTLSEYLRRHHNLFPRAHSVMAETCLTYLNSDQSKALPVGPLLGLTSMPFLKYCSRYWGVHAKRELSDRAVLLSMKLLDQYENHIAANTLFEQILDVEDSLEVNTPSRFGGLHCVSFFGIVDVMTGLLGMGGCDANRKDSAGLTPLTWAARGGQVEAVELLLRQEAVDPDKPDNKGNTPLSWAAINGHESVVGQLLDRKDVNPDKPDNSGNTPLSWAAIIGNESVAKQLLGRQGVTPDKPNNVGNTPLSWAAIKGHGLIVKQLLDRQDVNPDKPDNEGRTPLSWAAMQGHKLVVEQLLDRQDVNPDKPCNEDNTPLSWAAINGHESVVKKLLVRKDVNPDKRDDEGKTPLSWAAIQGHKLVVKQLLDRQDVNPDKPDNKGRTPLSWAAMQGHKLVVEQLLDRQDVNPDKPCNEDNTPLSWAAMAGHESVVKQLLDRKDVNPDKPDDGGKTPLSWAAIKGHELVVKQLLDRQDVNPDRPDDEGKTPLSWAAAKGHESVVKQLLDREDVNPTLPDKNGHIPLWYADAEGHEAVVNLLQAWKPPIPACIAVDELRASFSSSTL